MSQLPRTYAEPKYTEQMPWVGTPSQRAAIEGLAADVRVSRASVVRAAVDYFFSSEEPARLRDEYNASKSGEEDFYDG